MSTRPPVNRFPDFVGHTVQELKASCPTMGRKRIANTLERAGLHLAPSTAQRMINRAPPPPRPAAPPAKDTSVLAQDARNLDLTPVSARSGYSTPPLLYVVFAVLDQFLCVVAGFAVFGARFFRTSLRRDRCHSNDTGTSKHFAVRRHAGTGQPVGSRRTSRSVSHVRTVR